jgi:predicted aldo/keto reductase-like oxidoreductase
MTNSSKRIRLGKTGLEVYRLGFGGIPIQRVNEDQAVETVLHVVARGTDFIDTSRAYTTSERRIGLALQQIDKRVILASKSTSTTCEGLQADLETSLRELQMQYIDLYQCHFVQTEEQYRQIISPRGALEGLIKAKQQGLIGHIGITSHSLDLLDRILDDGLFETIMVCYSFLERAAQEKIIPKAIEKDVGVIAMKPFSGGIIDNARVALKYTLARSGILVLAGVENRDLWDENWDVFQGDSYTLTEAEEREMEAIAWGYDKCFCRRCDYCQPCQEDIPIQTILGLPSMVKRMGKKVFQDRQEAIEKARHCSECGECIARCPYQLPIPDLIKERLKWVDEQLQ